MSVQKLNYEKMAESISNLSQIASQMKVLLDDVASQLNRIGSEESEVWSGSSASEARANFNKLQSTFEDFVAVVESGPKFLSEVSEAYRHAEGTIGA